MITDLISLRKERLMCVYKGCKSGCVSTSNHRAIHADIRKAKTGVLKCVNLKRNIHSSKLNMVAVRRLFQNSDSSEGDDMSPRDTGDNGSVSVPRSAAAAPGSRDVHDCNPAFAVSISGFSLPSTVNNKGLHT
jgi:hypothetical protein